MRCVAGDDRQDHEFQNDGEISASMVWADGCAWLVGVEWRAHGDPSDTDRANFERTVNDETSFIADYRSDCRLSFARLHARLGHCRHLVGHVDRHMERRNFRTMVRLENLP